jgi:hypothetical protein
MPFMGSTPFPGGRIRKQTPFAIEAEEPRRPTTDSLRASEFDEDDGPIRPTLSMLDDLEADDEAGSVRPTLTMSPSEAELPPQALRTLPPEAPPSHAWSVAKVVVALAACATVVFSVVGLVSHFAKDEFKALANAPYTLLFPEKPDRAMLAASEANGRADARFDRKGRSPVAGGLMFIPPAFASEDGGYDLVIHFHGNYDVVEESFGLAKLNAVVVVMNLGNGSGPYEDRFDNPQNMVDLLERSNAALLHRGLRGAHRRRLALSAWSAGYGAVSHALSHPAFFADVDSVLLDDGIHAGYLPASTQIDTIKIQTFEKFAREAMAGRKLFSIAHSDVTPIDYAGTHRTTDALLADLGVKRGDPEPAPRMPYLKSIDGVVAKKSLRSLKPLSLARSGGLIVRGYAGDQPEDHNAHLFGMSVTTLPDLVARWAKQASPSDAPAPAAPSAASAPSASAAPASP